MAVNFTKEELQMMREHDARIDSEYEEIKGSKWRAEYFKYKDSRRRYYLQNQERIKKYRKEYYEKHKESINAKMREKRAKNREQQRNLSEEEREAMLKAQREYHRAYYRKRRSLDPEYLERARQRAAENRAKKKAEKEKILH